MLKNVIFDCGGVLFNWDPDAKMARYFPAEAASVMKPIIFRAWETLDDGSCDYQAYAEESFELAPDVWKPHTKRFFERVYYEMLPIEDTWALIGRLLARKYHIYLLSNAPTVLAEHAPEICPLMKSFDGIVVSAPIHLLKPNRDIYEYTLDKYGLNAAECLFVDDVKANVDGAIACGMHAYLYKQDADALLKQIEELSR